MSSIIVKNLSKKFQVGGVDVLALKDVSFTIEKKEMVAIVGQSGSGKSTLLHILGTLDHPTQGTISITGEDPFRFSDEKLSAFRNRHIGFVFQDNNLIPELTALENIMLPGIIGGRSRAQVKIEAKKLLSLISLEKREDHLPSELSGGEQQRIAIARALINHPSLILADEPTGSLDSKNATVIFELFEELNRTFKTTLVVVTHNKDYAERLPRRLWLLDGGLIRDERG